MGLIGAQNSLKTHRFKLRLEGLADPFYVQKLTPPTVEVQEVLAGAPGNLPDIKTPGKVTTGDMVVEMLRPSRELNDNGIWTGLAAAVAGFPSEIFRIGFLDYLAADSVAVQQTFTGTSMWVKKIEPSDLSNKDDADNVMVTVTFSVQMYFPSDDAAMAALFAGSAGGAIGSAGF